MIRIIAIGKKHDSWLQPGIERFQKRLRPPYDVSWLLLPYSAHYDQTARDDESEAIMKRLGDDDFVILLDETGKTFSTPEIAKQIELIAAQKTITLVIGGAYGVNQALKQRADFTWSFSQLVFPHMIMRLLVIEQLYRIQEVNKGGPYHHY
mgnify:CR=1 FL=1